MQVSSNAFRSDSDKMLSDMAEGSGDHYRDYDSTEEEEYGENGSGSGEGKQIEFLRRKFSIFKMTLICPGPGSRQGFEIINVQTGSNFTPPAGAGHSNRISASYALTCVAILLAALISSSSSRH